MTIRQEGLPHCLFSVKGIIGLISCGKVVGVKERRQVFADRKLCWNCGRGSQSSAELPQLGVYEVRSSASYLDLRPTFEAG